MKITVVGGGSTYTPELIYEIVNKNDELDIDELYLTDINEKRLDTIYNYGQRIIKKSGNDLNLMKTTERKKALKEADFVLLQIRVGGQEGRHNDIKLSLKYGMVGQETTGPGGFSKAMRTIPEVLKIAEDIKRYAKPNCFVLNFTNPSSIITQALSDHTDLEVIGLCNIPIILVNQSAKILNKEIEELSYDYVGLNHLGWLRHVYEQGEDKISELVEALIEDSEVYRAENIPAAEIDLIRSLNMIPSPYLQYFYFTEEIIEKLRTQELTRAEEVIEIDKELMKLFKTESGESLPEKLTERGGELYSRAAINTMNYIINNKKKLAIVNIKNKGTIDSLEDDDIIEVPALIDQKGAHPINIKKVEPHLLGLIQIVKAYERLTVKAAVNKDYNQALWALNTNPLVKDLVNANNVLNDINNTFALKLK